MKTKMLAACLLAAISLALISCNWFGKKKTTLTLTGKWKITNITDSSHAGLSGASFFVGFNADSINAVVTVISDSSLLFTSAKEPAGDTGVYHTDSGMHHIMIKGRSETRYETFAIKELNDTLLRVEMDSVHFILKKQP